MWSFEQQRRFVSDDRVRSFSITGLNGPQSVAFNQDQEIFVADWNGEQCVIAVFDRLGGELRRQFPAGKGLPRGLAICPVSGDVLVGTEEGGISFFTQQGVQCSRRLVPAPGTSIGKAIGIAVGGDGGIAVSSSEGLQTFLPTGESTGIDFPMAMERWSEKSWHHSHQREYHTENLRWSCSVGVSPHGDIIVPVRDPSYRRFPRIHVYSSMGKLLQIIGGDRLRAECVDSLVSEIDMMQELTVDEYGKIWFSRPGAIFSLEVRET
jgi:hypothetical protein